MALTEAGDIRGILEASRVVAATIPGIVSAYATTATVPPDDLKLPAVMQHAALADVDPSVISYTPSQEIVDHNFVLDVMVTRSKDLQEDQEAAMPFIPLVLKTYREQFKLGEAAVIHRCRPTGYRFVTVTYGDKTFFAVRFTMQVHAKTGVRLRA